MTWRTVASGMALALLCAGSAHGLQAGQALAWPPANSLQPGDGFFYPFDIDEDALDGAPGRLALDLNRPLAPSARIVARDGHFWQVGPDLKAGTQDDRRVRLYGVNLSFEANFPDAGAAARIAQRLRKLGFNAVRLHHLDTLPTPAGQAPRSVLTPGPYPSFNDEAVARLRGFIAALAREGIYTNLNLRVGYRFRPREDSVPDYDASTLQRPIAAPMLVYDLRMRRLQQTYARELIRRLGLRGNPALAMVEINNESSLLAAWSRHEWNDAAPPAYQPQLRQRWIDWLTHRYGSLEAACTAWGRCAGIDPSALLSPPGKSFPDSYLGTLAEKAAVRVRNSMAASLGCCDPAGPAAGSDGARLRDFSRFLADTDREYYAAMAATVHEETDAQVPVTGTQMGYGGVANLGAQEDMDYLDEHFYIDHPHFPNGHADPRNWRVWDVSLTGGKMDLLLRLGFLRDSRKPFVVSEYNHPFPSRQGAEIMPLMAAMASLQDWDGLFFFDYANAAAWPHAPANFALSGDWGKYVLAAQSARLFRSAALPPLARQTTLPLGAEVRAAIAATADPDAVWRHLSARHGIDAALAWRARVAADPLAGTRTPPRTDGPETSARRDFLYAPDRHSFVLKTPGTWALLGTIEGMESGSDDGLAAQFPTPGKHHAAIMLSALDDAPIEDSRRLLLSLGSATLGTQPGSSPPRPKRWVRHPLGAGSWTLEPDPGHPDRPTGSRQAAAPAWLAAMPVRLSWPSSATGAICVYPLDGTGRRASALPPALAGIQAGRAVLDLHSAPRFASPWFEVVSRPANTPDCAAHAAGNTPP